MGKATITNNFGGGQYQIDLQYDITAVTARIAGLTSEIDALNVYLPTLIAEKSAIKAKIDSLNSQLNQAIGDGEELPALTAITTSIAKLSPSYQITISKINNTNLQIDSYEREKAYLEINIIASESMMAWCADFSTELTGDVGTIEIDGDHEKGVLIYPAGCVGLYAAYNPAIHGAITPAIATAPANCYVNRSIYPAWQKYKPTFRLGEISSKNGDLCNINLDAATSREQALDINQTTTLSDVPIEYYCCDGDVFANGDRVVVVFENQDWSSPKVIGFESNPLPCEYDFIVKGLNTAFEVVSSKTNWGVKAATDSTLLELYNLNWRGRYVNGKPTLHLAWRGGNGRYFHTPRAPLNSPDNGAQVPTPRLPYLYKNGAPFAEAPADVLGAAIQDVNGVDYLYVIGIDDKIYRTLADNPPDIFSRVWTLMGAIDLSSVSSPPEFRNDWFFNGSGTAAVCVQHDGGGSTQMLRQAQRFRANIVDTTMIIDTFALEFVTFAGNSDNFTKAGNIGFAMDYKDDVLVEARLIVNTSKVESNTYYAHDKVYEYEMAGVRHLHYENAVTQTAALNGDTYETTSRTTTKRSRAGILYMDLRYDVSIVVKGWWEVPFFWSDAGPIFTKMYIRQGANQDEIDFLDEYGNGFMFNMGTEDSELAVNEFGNIFLIKDSSTIYRFMDIFAATSMNGGSLVYARNSAFAGDPPKSLTTGGKTGPEIGLDASFSIGTLR